MEYSSSVLSVMQALAPAACFICYCLGGYQAFLLDFYDFLYSDIDCKTIISRLRLFHGLEDDKHYFFIVYPFDKFSCDQIN